MYKYMSILAIFFVLFIFLSLVLLFPPWKLIFLVPKSDHSTSIIPDVLVCLIC